MSDETPNDSPYLTAKLAAAYLHINEKKLYELANAREVPAAVVGGKGSFRAPCSTPGCSNRRTAAR